MAKHLLIYAVHSLHRFVGGKCKVGVTPKATLATLMGIILTKAEPVSKMLRINTSIVNIFELCIWSVSIYLFHQ